MKGRLIVLDTLGGREAAALIVDGRLEDLLIDGDDPRPGTIYRARADRPMKGQGGLFVSTPDGTGFLKQVKGISPGASLLVQVGGHADPGKAVPVSQRLLFKSRHAIVTPEAPGLNVSRTIKDDDRRDQLMLIAKEAMAGSDHGLILRSSCLGAEDEAIAEDIAAMRALAAAVMADADGAPEKLVEGDGPHELAWREWTEAADVDAGEGAFARHGVPEMIDAVRSAEVVLHGGARMFVEATRALVAIDVNTGSDSTPAAGLKANIAAARDIPRQLRLRGLGGQVIVDFAPMPRKDRPQVEGALRKAFRGEPIETALVGWTTLGLYEVQRQRMRLPLDQVLA